IHEVAMVGLQMLTQDVLLVGVIPAGRIDATDPAGRDNSDEKDVLRQHLQADHCYLMDRWFAQFRLFNDSVAAQSSYVCRLRDNSNFEVAEQRPLSEAAQQAGVLQ